MAKYITLITIILTFILINLGGYVHNSGASLACPDWPLCYGQVMPEMKGGVLVEHSHRMLASLVGFLTILIVFFTRKTPNISTKLKRMTWVALVMVILQGLLGGLTVIYKLPTFVSTSHLALSMIYFLTLIWIHHRIVQEQKPVTSNLKLEKSRWNLSFKHFVLGLLGLVYFQIVLGALMRHLGLGGACGVGMSNAIKCFDIISFTKSFFPSSAQAQIHMGHRYIAGILSLLIISLSIYAYRFISKVKLESSGLKSISKYFIFASVVVILQVKLGILTIASNIAEIQTTLHLAGAALLLALMWKLYLTILSFEKEVGLAQEPSYIGDLASLTKPRLSGLVIVTAALGLYLAPGEVGFFKSILSIISTALIVAGACTINCYMEKDVDKLMQRTANRPLPSGRISAPVALTFGALLLLVNIPILYFYVNPLTAILGLTATLFYVFLYTPMKKKSTMAVFVGAVPGAIPPLMGWTTVTNSLDLMGLLLFGILFVWQLPHFLSISIFYAEDYKNADIKVLPNVSGVNSTKVWIVIYTLLLMLLSVSPAFLGERGMQYFYASLLIGFSFLVFSIFGLWTKNESGVKSWARNYFWGSLMYLPGVLLLMVVTR